jgi:hypothetical protein
MHMAVYRKPEERIMSNGLAELVSDINAMSAQFKHMHYVGDLADELPLPWLPCAIVSNVCPDHYDPDLISNTARVMSVGNKPTGDQLYKVVVDDMGRPSVLTVTFADGIKAIRSAFRGIPHTYLEEVSQSTAPAHVSSSEYTQKRVHPQFTVGCKTFGNSNIVMPFIEGLIDDMLVEAATFCRRRHFIRKGQSWRHKIIAGALHDGMMVTHRVGFSRKKFRGDVQIADAFGKVANTLDQLKT